MEKTEERPTPEVEQLCQCSECRHIAHAFPDATGKWDCKECGHRHYPSKSDYGTRIVFRGLPEQGRTPEGSEPTPKEVTVCVGICGNVSFMCVVPEGAHRDCMTECLADKFTESGRYKVRCSAAKDGNPMSSDFGWECEPTIEKIEDEEERVSRRD